MKTKINRMMTLAAAALLPFAGCKKLSDTYQWSENQGIFTEVRWSFTQAPAADTYSKSDAFKSYFKNTAPITSYNFTVYNNSETNVSRMAAEFTGGTLWLNDRPLASGVPFPVEGKQLTFTFKLSDTNLNASASASVYTYAQNLPKQLTTYTLALQDNQKPTAMFTIAPETDPLTYTFDAAASADGDADLGGTLKAFIWTITDAADGAKTQTVKRPASQSKLTYPFPYPGNFTVTLTAKDSEDADSAPYTQSLTVQ